MKLDDWNKGYAWKIGARVIGFILMVLSIVCFYWTVGPQRMADPFRFKSVVLIIGNILLMTTGVAFLKSNIARFDDFLLNSWITFPFLLIAVCDFTLGICRLIQEEGGFQVALMCGADLFLISFVLYRRHVAQRRSPQDRAP